MNSDYNDIDALIGKELSGEISSEERTVVNNWLELSAENQAYYNHFKTLFERSLELKHQEAFDTDAAWGKLKEKIKNRTQTKKTIQLSWKIAASIVLLLTAGFFAYQKFLTPQQATTLAAANQAVDKMLPDGTNVFLNKNTSVEYVYDPIKKIRKTKLKGEAYFNIAEKEKQEFLLEVDGLLIKDIGTSFNVKAYPGSDTVEVYVETGEIIFYTALDSGLHLKEKETGFYDKASGRFSKLIQPDENILAYKTQIFVFDNTLLSEVVEAINEVYDTKLKLEKKELENCRITVTFRHETIEMIAEVIAETLSLTSEKTEHEITLKGNGCSRKCILTFLLLLLAAGSMAQTVPLLEQPVTLELSDEPVEKALKKISKEAKITFSYTSSDIDLEQNVTASFKAKTVREILELIFKGNVSFKEKGKYIILTKVPPAPKKTSSIQPKSPLFINGYIRNAVTGEKISGVSIYDTRTLTAAVSNDFGYFSMMLKEPENENRLAVSRKSYTDTLVIIKEDTYVFINIPLSPETLPEVPAIVKYDTISMIDTVFVAQQIVADTTHQDTTASVEPVWNTGTKDTIFYRKFQSSLVPFVSTNGKNSDKTINDYSLNLIGGYTAGTKKLELGGLFNIDLGDVSYIQLAGLMNFNEGRMRGFQTAGLFNTNRKGIKGFQVAGITNVNNGRSDGAQVAGVINIQTKQFRGAQVAGVMNLSKGKMKGIQIAPLVNYASNLKGVQIAFINVADTLRGVPIGFISYVKRGYHKLEISADEIFYTNVAFRTGTYKFYNIFTLGVKPESDPNDEDQSTEWTFGYGFGMAPYIFDWLSLNIDLTCNQLSKGEFTPAINLLNKAYVGLEVQPFDRIGIAFGVTLNGHLTKNSYEGYYDIFTDYRPEIIKEHDYNNNTHLTMWWGFKGAIRFF